MPVHPPKLNSLADRLLLGLARRGGSRDIIILATGVRKLLSPDRDIASKYFAAIKPSLGQDRALDFQTDLPARGYRDTLVDSERDAYFLSLVKLMQYSFPQWEESVCVIPATDADVLLPFEQAGYSNLEGLAPASSSQPSHPAIRAVESPRDVGKTYRSVAVFDFLEYVDPHAVDDAVDAVCKLAEEVIAASIPIYPDSLLDFFTVDPARRTLQTRSWWNEVFSRHGFQAAEPPSEELPQLTPFLYRRRRLRQFAVNAAESAARPDPASAVAGQSPKVVCVLPGTDGTFYRAARGLVQALGNEMIAARTALPGELPRPEVAEAPFKITWAHFEGPYRGVRVSRGKHLEYFTSHFQIEPKGSLTGWLREMMARDSIKLVPSAFCRAVLEQIGCPAGRIEVIPHGFTPEFAADGIEALSPATRKPFRFLAVVDSTDPMRYGLDLLLHGYRMTFRADDDVTLIVQDIGTADATVRKMLEPGDGPEIVYYAGPMSYRESASLHAACSAFVAPFRGEAFGRRILDAAVIGLPLVMPRYGGPLDFCTKDVVQSVDYVLKPVGECLATNRLRWREELTWCEPNVEHLAERMRWVSLNITAARQQAAVLRDRVKQAFSWKWSARKLMQTLHD